MKKFLAGVLVVGAGLAFGLAAWSAWTAQARHRALVDVLVRRADVRLLDSSYAGGWLRSSAQTSLELRGAAGRIYAERLGGAGVADVRERVGLRVRHEIAHGPIPIWEWLRDGVLGAPVVARVETRIELDNETESELAEVFGRLPPLRLETTVLATGRAETRIAAGPGRFVWRHLTPEERESELAEEDEEGGEEEAPVSADALPEPLRVEWRGLVGRATAHDVFGVPEEITARIELPRIGLARDERIRRARELRLDLDLRGVGTPEPEIDWTLRLASIELARLTSPEAGAGEAAPAGGDEEARGSEAGAPDEAPGRGGPAEPAAEGEGEPPAATIAAREGDEAESSGEPSEADREVEHAVLVLEGGGAWGRLKLGGSLEGTLEAEIASVRTAGASLGPLRLALDWRAGRAVGPGPAAEATLSRLALDTPEGPILGEGRLRIAKSAAEGTVPGGFAKRLGGELLLEAPTRVADWLRVRSPAVRRLLDAHAGPASEGERVRARLRLDDGALESAPTTTARRE